MNAKQFATILAIVLMGAAGGILAAQSSQIRPQTQPLSPNPADRKWQYCVVTDPSWEDLSSRGMDYLHNRINQLEDQGYEVISIQKGIDELVNPANAKHYYNTMVLLRREKK